MNTNVIVDYGMGNLRSVQKGIEEIGFDARISSDPEVIRDAGLLIVPGVGAFDRAVKNLRNNGLWEPTVDHLRASRPFLGICLGFQLLFEGSEEGELDGFAHYEGYCQRFRDVSPIPHMGWNEVDWVNSGTRYDPERTEPPCYYFVHSFFPVPEDSSLVAGQTEYGDAFCSAVADETTLGVQFHPEKSQYAGLNLLEQFLNQHS